MVVLLAATAAKHADDALLDHPARRCVLVVAPLDLGVEVQRHELSGIRERVLCQHYRRQRQRNRQRLPGHGARRLCGPAAAQEQALVEEAADLSEESRWRGHARFFFRLLVSQSICRGIGGWSWWLC